MSNVHEGWTCKSNTHIPKGRQRQFFRLLNSIFHGGKEADVAFNNILQRIFQSEFTCLNEHCYWNTKNTSILEVIHVWLFSNDKKNIAKGLQCSLLPPTNFTAWSLFWKWKNTSMWKTQWLRFPLINPSNRLREETKG